MEQKFTFKRMLSLLVVFSMLFASFAVLAVAEDASVIGIDRVNHYDWTEKQYNSADYPDTAVSAGEVLASASTDSTKSVYAALGGTFFKWWYKILAEYDDESGAFIISAIDAPGATDYESWTLGEGKLFITCNSGYASTDAAGNKADADVIKTLVVGDKLYLSTDLASLQAASGALTDVYVQVNEPIASTEPDPEPTDGIVVDGDLSEWGDNWIDVNAETGYWQNPPADETADAPYKFQMATDDTNLYVAVEHTVLETTGIRIWFRTNDEATVYTSFYDIEADSVRGKYNTSLTTNSGAVIEDSDATGSYVIGEESITVEFSVSLEELGAVDGEFEYYINAFDGIGTLYYPPVVAVDNGDGTENRLANLPYNNWYVASAEEPVTAITVNPTNNFKYAAGEVILVPWTMGDTLESILDKEYEWFNFAVLTWDADNSVYTVSDVKIGTDVKLSSGNENGVDYGVLEIPEYGFILGAHSDAVDAHDAIASLEVGDVVYIYGTDVTNATIETASDATVTTVAIEGETAFAPTIDAPVENYKAEINVNDYAILTDGESEINVAWFDGANAKAQLINNAECTDKAMDVTVLYALDGTKKIESLALTFFHEGVTMIGYPEGTVLVEVSTDGTTYAIIGEFDLAEAPLSVDTYGTVTNVFEFDAVEAAYVKASFTVGSSTAVLGDEPADGKVFWEFAALSEVAVTESVPVTSQVVNAFNVGAYSEGSEGSNGAYIFTDADQYAKAGLAWWRHVAFAPTANEGVYEVVAITSGTGGTSGGLEIPEGGFIWCAFEWPESGSGAYALEVMNALNVGGFLPSYVEFVGVDIANCTTEADATATVWVDPDAPVNAALNKDYTLSGEENATYNAKLTDGLAHGTMTYGGEWFAFTAANTDENGVGYVIIDLGIKHVISDVLVNLVNDYSAGVVAPEYINIYATNDLELWGDAVASVTEFDNTEKIAYWSEVNDLALECRYVMIEIKRGGTFAFLNEIEVYGYEIVGIKENPDVIEIVDGRRGPAGEGLAEDLEGGAEYYWAIEIPMDGNLSTSFYAIDDEWNNYVVEFSYNGGELMSSDVWGNPELEVKAGETVILYAKLAEDAPVVDVTAYVSIDPVGSMSNPADAELGENESVIGENDWDGMSYEYVVEADGYLTITMAADNENGWFYAVNNYTTYIYGDSHYSDDNPVVSTETIQVKKDDVIGIAISTNGGMSTAGTVAWTLTFAEPEKAPEDAIFSGSILTHAGFAVGDSTILVRLGELDTVAEVAAALRGLDLTDAEQAEKADYNYYYAITVDADGNVVEVNYELGRPAGVKSDMVIPEGGYAILVNAQNEEAANFKTIEVGQKIVLTSVDLEALAEATESSDLFYAYYSVYDAAPETVEIALGDIDMDGDVDQYDYILAKRAHFNNITLTESQAKVGDMDADGDNDQYDYILIKRIHFNNYSTDATVEIPVADVPVKNA